MARIPQEEIERLKSEISVERLVEAAGVAVRKASKDLLGRCPFHDDTEASLVVTPAKNLWHCFGCQLPVKVSTVRALPAPVALDADDQALLN